MEISYDEGDEVEALVLKELGVFSRFKGRKFVEDVLNGTNENFLENFRMDKQVFHKLCDMLHTRGLLRHTNHNKIEEQLAIFMFTVGRNLRTRKVQELFGCSGETISRHFNNVLSAITTISLDLFQPPKSDLAPEIQQDPRFYPYFQNCIGAVDSIHVPVIVGVDVHGPFRNSKGLLSQHVLVACSFDMKFHYVLAGWEGSAPDMMVLNSALTRRNKLEVPNGKYYLVDAKYANIPGFIASYPEKPYNQLYFGGNFFPQDAKELFNQRHFLLHGVSRRTFAALKERFPILTSAHSYPLSTQVKLVVAACALHNFIREENPSDWIFNKYQEDASLGIEDSTEQSLLLENTQVSDMPFTEEELERANHVRDSIAGEMWDDYVGNFAAIDNVE